MIIRIKSPSGQTDNHGEENLYDWAIPFAGFLVTWEIPFSYSYPGAECRFEILEPTGFLELLEAERDGEFHYDVL